MLAGGLSRMQSGWMLSSMSRLAGQGARCGGGGRMVSCWRGQAHPGRTPGNPTTITLQAAAAVLLRSAQQQGTSMRLVRAPTPTTHTMVERPNSSSSTFLVLSRTCRRHQRPHPSHCSSSNLLSPVETLVMQLAAA